MFSAQTSIYLQLLESLQQTFLYHEAQPKTIAGPNFLLFFSTYCSEEGSMITVPPFRPCCAGQKGIGGHRGHPIRTLTVQKWVVGNSEVIHDF